MLTKKDLGNSQKNFRLNRKSASGHPLTLLAIFVCPLLATWLYTNYDPNTIVILLKNRKIKLKLHHQGR